MLKRVSKQAVIAILFFIILAAIALAASFLFFKKEPTEENGNNEPPLTLRKIEVLETAAVQSKAGYHDLAAKIKNPNNSHGAFSLPYEFKVYSVAGSLLNVRQGETFILPASEKYVVETKLELKEPPGQVEFNVSEAKWKKFEEYQPELFIYDKRFGLVDEPGIYAQASGILRNTSPFDLEEVNINIILRDLDKKIIGLNSHKVFTLSSGQDRYFAARWFSPLSGTALHLEIEPEFNVFVDDNFIRRYGILEKFQEF